MAALLLISMTATPASAAQLTLGEAQLHELELSVTTVTGRMAGASYGLKWSDDGKHCEAVQSPSRARPAAWKPIEAEGCEKVREYLRQNAAALTAAAAALGKHRTVRNRTLGQLRLLDTAFAVNLMTAETCDVDLTHCEVPKLDTPSELALRVRQAITAGLGRLARPSPAK